MQVRQHSSAPHVLKIELSLEELGQLRNGDHLSFSKLNGLQLGGTRAIEIATFHRGVTDPTNEAEASLNRLAQFLAETSGQEMQGRMR